MNDSYYKDVLLVFMCANFQNETDPEEAYAMNFSLASVHLHDLSVGEPDKCALGAGPVGQAAYTKITCNLLRPVHVPDEEHIAYPTTTTFLRQQLLLRAIRSRVSYR